MANELLPAAAIGLGLLLTALGIGVPEIWLAAVGGLFVATGAIAKIVLLRAAGMSP